MIEKVSTISIDIDVPHQLMFVSYKSKTESVQF